MTTLAREPERCPNCAEALAQVGGGLCCPRCDWRAAADDEVLTLRGSEVERVAAIIDRLARRGRLAAHEGQPVFVNGNALLPLVDGTTNLLATAVMVSTEVRDRNGVVTGETPPSYLKPHQATTVMGRVCHPDAIAALPVCHLNVPRSVLWIDASGAAAPTLRGLGAHGVLTGEEIVPAPTGGWRRFLDGAFWQSDEDRRNYEAWCLCAVLPLEIGTYPMLVASANGQSAGKTWLGRSLAWALGYASTCPLELNADKCAQPLRRHIYGSMKTTRVLELDNRRGSDAGAIESNTLSEILTDDVVSCDDLYRLGVAFIRNRAMIILSMNAGTISEDLAIRSIGVRLDFDPDDARVEARSRLGALYWRRPEVSRAVLAEILWEAQRRWNETRGWTLPAGARFERHEEWHGLAMRLTGRAIAPVGGEVRELGQIEGAVLRACLSEPATTVQLAERLTKSATGALRTWAARGPKVLSLKLKEWRRLEGNGALRCEHTRTGTQWSWEA